MILGCLIVYKCVQRRRHRHGGYHVTRYGIPTTTQFTPEFETNLNKRSRIYMFRKQMEHGLIQSRYLNMSHSVSLSPSSDNVSDIMHPQSNITIITSEDDDFGEINEKSETKYNNTYIAANINVIDTTTIPSTCTTTTVDFNQERNHLLGSNMSLLDLNTITTHENHQAIYKNYKNSHAEPETNFLHNKNYGGITCGARINTRPLPILNINNKPTTIQSPKNTKFRLQFNSPPVALNSLLYQKKDNNHNNSGNINRKQREISKISNSGQSDGKISELSGGSSDSVFSGARAPPMNTFNFNTSERSHSTNIIHVGDRYERGRGQSVCCTLGRNRRLSQKSLTSNSLKGINVSSPIILVSPNKATTNHYQRLNSPVISTLKFDYITLNNPQFVNSKSRKDSHMSHGSRVSHTSHNSNHKLSQSEIFHNGINNDHPQSHPAHLDTVDN